jgi:hypothetical protein
LEFKEESEFNTEHVIHKSLTSEFNPYNLTLKKSVCFKCNKSLGDTIDVRYARGYWEGIARYQNELKDPSEANELSTKNIEFLIENREAFSKEVGDFKSIVADHLILERSDGSLIRFTRKQLASNALPDLVNLNEIVYFRIFASTEENNRLIADLSVPYLEKYGFNSRQVYKHEVIAKVVYDEFAFRAITKIAFNYLSKMFEHAPEVALASAFHQARKFIRYAHKPNFSILKLVNENTEVKIDGLAFQGHWINLYREKSSILAEMSIFNRAEWRIILSPKIIGHEIEPDFRSIHVWNLKTRICEKIDPARFKT